MSSAEGSDAGGTGQRAWPQPGPPWPGYVPAAPRRPSPWGTAGLATLVSFATGALVGSVVGLLVLLLGGLVLIEVLAETTPDRSDGAGDLLVPIGLLTLGSAVVAGLVALLATALFLRSQGARRPWTVAVAAHVAALAAGGVLGALVTVTPLLLAPAVGLLALAAPTVTVFVVTGLLLRRTGVDARPPAGFGSAGFRPPG